MTPRLANVLLTVAVGAGVGLVFLFLYAGFRYLLGYGEPKDGYQSKRVRNNRWMKDLLRKP